MPTLKKNRNLQITDFLVSSSWLTERAWIPNIGIPCGKLNTLEYWTFWSLVIQWSKNKMATILLGFPTIVKPNFWLSLTILYINITFLCYKMVQAIQKFSFLMVWTIGELNKMAAILSTIGKLNTIGIIWIPNIFRIPGPTAFVYFQLVSGGFHIVLVMWPFEN